MRLFALVLLALASTGAHAAAREKLNVFSRDIQGLSANFSQRVFSSDGVLKESSSGTVKLQAPRQFNRTSTDAAGLRRETEAHTAASTRGMSSRSPRKRTSDVTPSAEGCEDCLKTGDTWVHLRMCMTCGHVGCCDSSKNKHATKHFHGTKHPIIRSAEPGEGWYWCYVDELLLDSLPPA